jgi:hypothetical protein
MKGGPNCPQHRRRYWPLVGELNDAQRERLGLSIDCFCDMVPRGNSSSAMDADRLMSRNYEGPNGLPRLWLGEKKNPWEGLSGGQQMMESGIFEVRFDVIRDREDARDGIGWLWESGTST